MKRLLSAILVIAMLAGLCACSFDLPNPNPSEGETEKEPTDPEGKEDPPEEEPPEEDPPEEDPPEEDPPEEDPPEPFERTAQAILNEFTVGCNIGNTLDGHYYPMGKGSLKDETVYGNPKITKQLIQAIKAKGFNAIRLPVTWYSHLNPETFEVDSAWMARVAEVVDMILAEDLFCIINVHHDSNNKNDKWLNATPEKEERTRTIFKKLWEQIAAKFCDRGEKLLFEGFNEVCADVDGSTFASPAAHGVLNRLNQLFVDTVRKSGGNNAKRYLICSTYFTRATAGIIEGFVLPTDTVADHLIVQTHIYTYERTMLYDLLDGLYDRFVSQGIPVFIGECGQKVPDRTTEETVNWAHWMMERAEAYGLRICIWETGNTSNYKVFNRTDYTCRQPEMVAALMEEVAKRGTDAPLPERPSGEPVTGNLLAGKWNKSKSSSADATFEIKGNSFTVNATTSGTNMWDVQMYYTSLSLEAGKTYRLSFDYTSSIGYVMPLFFQTEGKTKFIECALGDTDDGHIERTFRCYEDMQDLIVMVYCGGAAATCPYTFTLSDLSLCEVAESE